MISQHQTKTWKVLCWNNVRGINSSEKWNAIRDRISESGRDIICLQETKRQQFDIQFIKNFCPVSFDAFEYLPSVGASGGIITIWKSAQFTGSLAFSNNFVVSIDFHSNHDQSDWVLTNVYGPCTPEGKLDFIQYFKDNQMPEDVD
jgi:exonuclease III